MLARSSIYCMEFKIFNSIILTHLSIVRIIITQLGFEPLPVSEDVDHPPSPAIPVSVPAGAVHHLLLREGDQFTEIQLVLSLQRPCRTERVAGPARALACEGGKLHSNLPLHANCPVFVRTSRFFHSSIKLILTSVPLLYENSPLRPDFLNSMYNTFLLCPAMSREIQRRVPLLSWLKLACMSSIQSY